MMILCPHEFLGAAILRKWLNASGNQTKLRNGLVTYVAQIPNEPMVKATCKIAIQPYSSIQRQNQNYAKDHHVAQFFYSCTSASEGDSL